MAKLTRVVCDRCGRNQNENLSVLDISISARVTRSSVLEFEGELCELCMTKFEAAIRRVCVDYDLSEEPY